MRSRNFLYSLLSLSAVGLLFVQCSSPGSDGGPSDGDPQTAGPANLSLLLTDAPVDATAVYINVVETDVRFAPAPEASPTPAPATDATPTPATVTPTPAPTPSPTPVVEDDDADDDADEQGDDEGEGEWITVDATAVTYDLLTLQDGVTAALGEAQLETGTVSQIRLVLDSANPGSIVVDGETYPLTVPSGSESGLKLNGDIALTAGMTTTVVIDFDAEKSIVATGNGEYKLKPVLAISSVDAIESSTVTAD